jgi:dTDP-glucose 4,6-dehydratase
MKRLLLTGAGGFVGHHTLGHLLKTTDWEIVVTDSFRHFGTSSRLRAVFDELPQHRSRVKVITHDLNAPIDHVTANEIGKIDYIINMASNSHVDRSITEPRPFVENNVALQLTMLEFARTLPNLEIFLHISTDEVYGPAPIGNDHAEWSEIIPSNPYSASKAAQEALAISYWRTYGIPVVISNTMNIIGERQDVEKFVPLSISRILKGEQVPVHAKEVNGEWISGSRFYLHARNQADALRFILISCSSAPLRYSDGLSKPERFNVRGEVEIHNDDMVELIAELMGLGESKNHVKYVNVEGTRPGHDLRYALTGDKLFGMGWKPPVPLRESLDRTIRWTRANPEWLL